MIYLTSDTHFNHPNICGPKISKWKSGYRNFDSLKEMDDTIINGINDKVPRGGILIHCGDFGFFRNQPTLYYTYRERIFCERIYLVLGNHDKDIRKHKEQLIKDRVFYDILDKFPFRIYWNRSNKGVNLLAYHYDKPRDKYPFIIRPDQILVHGHIHTNPPKIQTEPYKSIDIGVDGNNFKPYSIKEVLEKLGYTQEIDYYQMEHNNF